jgi:hypothetical protein
LLFDSQKVIYAEGIAAESMLINTRTKPLLPAHISKDKGDVIPGHSDRPHAGLDVQERLAASPGCCRHFQQRFSTLTKLS